MPSVVSVEASEVPKKALGYCFEIDQLVVGRHQALRPGAHRAAFDEVMERHRLLVEAAAVERRLVVDDVGVDDRDVRPCAPPPATRIAEASASSTPA